MYCAPKILRREKYDTSCDMWALGCAIYLLVSGFTPFNLHNCANVQADMLPSHGEYTFPDIYCSHISLEAKDLIIFHQYSRFGK